MRNRKTFLSVAIAAAAVLLAGTVARGGGPKRARASRVVPQQAQQPLTTCMTPNEVVFTVTSGPSFVSCQDDPSGQCTEIEYEVSSGGAVYALEGKGVVPSEAYQVAPACEGINGFGQGSCHEQAVRTVLKGRGKFKITLAGARRPSPTSVGIGTEVIEACEILGVGLEDSRNPDQITQTSETVDFKGCVVEFTRDAETGEVVRAQLTEDSPQNCAPLFPGEGRTLVPQPVNTLELRLRDAEGTSLGDGKFGDGYISTGGDSCTTRVIGGKLYTWGTPCP